MSTVTNERISSEPAPLPSGPAAAAILAGGLGTAFYGLMVDLAEWFPKSIGAVFTLNKGVGPLSGKTTFGMLGFFAIWAVLASMWKGKDVNVEKVWKVSLALIILGLIFTFPTFFMIFAPE